MTDLAKVRLLAEFLDIRATTVAHDWFPAYEMQAAA